MNPKLQSALGWIAVAISALLGAFLGLFAGAEGAADGWGPLLAHLSQVLIVVFLSVAAVRWPRAGGALLVVAAVALALRFNVTGALLFAPLALAGALYFFGRPQPRRVAYVLLLAVPLGFTVLTALSVVMARFFG